MNNAWLMNLRQNKALMESFREDILWRAGTYAGDALGAECWEDVLRAQGANAALRALANSIDKEDRDAFARAEYDRKAGART